MARGNCRDAAVRCLEPQRPERAGFHGDGQVAEADLGCRDQPVVADSLRGGHAVELDDASLRRLQIADADRRCPRQAELDPVEAGPVIEVAGAPHPLRRPPVACAPGMVALSEPPQLDSLAVDYHVSLYPARISYLVATRYA